MKKRSQLYIFIGLILLKQDIRELIQVFQTNLENVEIVIDDLNILDSSQLEQFDAAYQAKFLLARGYSHEALGEDTKNQGEYRFIELRASKEGATLLLRGWDNVRKAEPEVSMQIRRVLLHRQNHFQRFTLLCVTFSFFYLFLPLQLIAEQHHLSFITQLFFEIGGGILLGAAAFFLFLTIVRLLRLETRIFLFPGAMETTRAYGRREAIGTTAVALILLVFISVILVVAFRLLWE